MTLKSRLPKINQVANSPTTRKVYARDKSHKVYHVDSVRTGAPFQVVCNWSKNGCLQLQTELVTFSHKEMTKEINGRKVHPANYNHTVCYQALGVAKKMAKEAGKTLSLCKDYQSAVKLLNFGGELVKIVNLNGGTVWATVR